MKKWIFHLVRISVINHNFKMMNKSHTPALTLRRAQIIAQKAGLNYVYVGNVYDKSHSSTYCSNCRKILIEREWYELGEYHIKNQHCSHCGYKIHGHFENPPGDWGRKRVPVNLSEYEL